MKKCSLVIVFVLLACASQAQFVVGTVLNQTVGRIIRAIDLKVQRMQNQTIWLQNAQKALENELSKLRLSEIAGWSGQQQQLYSQYYSELGQIKSYISYYQRIKNLTMKQAALINEYQNAWSLLHNDRHFTVTEMSQIQQVYTGILNASAKNLDQIMLVINPGKTQMSDEQRLELINKAGDQLDGNYSDLKQFNAQNEMLSLQRAKDEKEVATLKNYYGIH
ncbi:MAG: conjugal transfer protein TraI [Bacteroidota bacterium]|nr:conjugal transfer protein TraI [Bacteroidota bacterium]